MEKIKITNRSSFVVGYSIPEMNIARDFAPSETRTITKEELQKLIFQPGGQNLVDSYFQIEDPETAKEFSPWVANEPEYYYTSDTITQLLTTGTIDELLDCLDFGPDGAKELIKSLAISIPCTDTIKLDAISKYFGINLSRMIEIAKEEKAEKEASGANTKGRRTSGIKTEESAEEVAEPAQQQRRTSPALNKYTVINRK